MNNLITAVKGFTFKSRFFRDTTLLISATAFGQGLIILASPVLTRLYTPKEFGLLAVYSSLLGILSIVASFNYEIAVPLPEDDCTAANVLVLALGLSFINSLCLSVCIFFFHEYIVQLTNTPSLKPYLWLLPIGFWAVGIYQAFNYWAIRKKTYSIIAKTRLAQKLGQVITQVGLGMLKIGPIGLISGFVVGQTAGIGTFVRQAWTRDKDRLHDVTLQRMRLVFFRYRKFPLYQSGAAVLMTTGNQIPALLLAAFYGPQVTGWYFLAQRVVETPVVLISRSISQVFLGEVAELARNNPRHLQRLFNKITLRLVLIGIVPCLVLAVGASSIVNVVFGEEWIETGIYIQVMAFVLFLRFATESVINLALIERQELALTWSIIQLTLVTISIITAFWLGLSSIIAIALLSLARIISLIVKYLMWSSAIRRKIAEHEKMPKPFCTS